MPSTEHIRLIVGEINELDRLIFKNLKDEKRDEMRQQLKKVKQLVNSSKL